MTQEQREARALRAQSGGGSMYTCTEESAGGLDGVRGGKRGWMKVTESQVEVPSRPGKESDWDVALGKRVSAFMLECAGISVTKITGAVDQFLHIREAENGQHKGNGSVCLTAAKLSCARLFQRKPAGLF